jgi:hypothetical protein
MNEAEMNIKIAMCKATSLLPASLITVPEGSNTFIIVIIIIIIII